MQAINSYTENAGELLEEFVLQHQPLVKKIALYIKRRLPSHIEFDDLLQSGLVGLLEAKQNFKPDMGATFETYASLRIRGAIIDSLRKNSWVSRETLKNMKRISDAIAKVEQQQQKQATTEDIAAELGISTEEHFKIAQEINVLHVISLTDLGDENAVLSTELENPQQVIQQSSIKTCLQEVLAELPEREQLVLSLYYVEELTLKQIGEVLEVTEARVCQLHSQAIVRVRLKMQEKNLLGVNA